MKICLLSILFIFFSCLYGCSLPPLHTDRSDRNIQTGQRTSEPQELLQKLEQRNSTLKSFKGIGSIALKRNGILRIKERVAWIGARPVSFYIVILVSGHPSMKLSGNGQWFFFHNLYDKENTYRKIRSNDPSLKRLIQLPLKASEFIAILSGRIPIINHHSIELLSDQTGDDILILKKRGRIRQKIYLAHDNLFPYKMEIFGRRGALIYSARFDQAKRIEEYNIPMKVTIYAEEKKEVITCQLVIDQYWPNVPVSPSMFVLPSTE